jgi:hypothetical protein
MAVASEQPTKFSKVADDQPDLDRRVVQHHRAAAKANEMCL